MKPLVSILIPAYNAEEWIADTIRSAARQTWEPKEIIVVDDGSTDRTSLIAHQFEWASVRVVRQRNQGAAAARNTAFSMSHGDYIQWLDADDLLAPDKIARQMEVPNVLGSPRTLLSAAWGYFIYRPYRTQFRSTSLWCDLSPVEFLLRKLGQRAFMQTAVWLVSRELAEAAGPWDRSLVYDDDGEYFCRVILASTGIRFAAASRVYYRIAGSGSVSNIGQSEAKLGDMWRSMQLQMRYLRSLEDSDRTRAACVRYLEGYLVAFWPQRLDIVEEMHEAARALGASLESPRLSWKYSWINSMVGWSCAKRVQLFLRNAKWSWLHYWEKALYRIESRIFP